VQDKVVPWQWLREPPADLQDLVVVVMQTSLVLADNLHGLLALHSRQLDLAQTHR
jgi:hypothetical protein